MPLSTSEKTIVSDLLEALGQHMQQETPYKLLNGTLFRLDLGFALDIFIVVILVGETDLTVFYRQDTPVADGDAVTVAAQILNHRFGAGKRRLAVNVPGDGLLFLHEGLEGLTGCQVGRVTLEGQLVLATVSTNDMAETFTEHNGQLFDVDQEFIGDRYPAFVVE